MLAAPITLKGQGLDKEDGTGKIGPIDWRGFTKIPKTGAIASAHWKYLFETAKCAWSRITLDMEALEKLNKTMADVPDSECEQQESLGRRQLPISAGTADPEAQRIAIQQNVDLLKKKPDHYDRVFQYLEAELFGRRSRQKKRDLTEKQYHLIARLRDNADDFVLLYDERNEEEEEEEVEDDSYFIEEEDRLLRERDELIVKIREQLAMPINAPDDVEPSHSPVSEKPELPEVPQKIEYVTESNEPEPPVIPVKLISSEHNMNTHKGVIDTFGEITGSNDEISRTYLIRAGWDIDVALSDFYEPQPQLKQPTLPAAKYSEGELASLEQFIHITKATDGTAESYLKSADWCLGPAVSNYFADGDALRDAVKAADQASSAKPSKISATINDRPVHHICVGTNDTQKRLAISSRDPAKALTAQVAVRNKRIQKIKSEMDANQRAMHELAIGTTCEEPIAINQKSQKICHPPRVAGPPATGERTSRFERVFENKKREVAPSPPQKGLSHAGLPLSLDESGNVIPPTEPIGTPYQQYLAMRRRLQIQHYGHEAIDSNGDPLRGVPTRERCEPPIVQEGSSSSDDSTNDQDGESTPPASPSPPQSPPQPETENLPKLTIKLKFSLGVIEEKKKPKEHAVVEEIARITEIVDDVAAAQEHRKALFVSNEEDAWDGYDSDDQKVDCGSDFDAEGESDGDEEMVFPMDEGTKV
ncbi:hypothetical protein ACJQWK_09982 [Exserohilum turcicum]|uniref:Uncharacterized protein n=1 Tax=Exserohilum turcicum (strain 28A) TaxID=671987 RepID=R0JTX2_EXST2|nr:uncharacterized protein SETTUDRAFT_24497 [Exserohilum turcica Et28A]EOA80984.1 hypothetical protein SETTUDRAFT_24497 [Exserohilum turcica Et28A]